MRIRRKGTVLIFLGILIALFSFTASGALTFLNMERLTDASASKDDASGIISLDGFSGEEYRLSPSFTTTGTITNRSTRPLIIRLFTDPKVTAQNKNVDWQFELRVLDADGKIYNAGTFSGNGSSDPAGEWSGAIAVPAGKSLTLQANLNTTREKNFRVDVHFGLEAEDDAGFSVKLPPTYGNTRKQRYIVQ